MQKRNRKLTDYMRSKPTTTGDKERQAPLVQEVPQPQNTDIISELIETATKRFELQKSTTTSTPHTSRGAEREELSSKKQDSSTQKTMIDNVSNQLAEEAFKRLNVKLITCDKQGRCTDDKRVGDVYKDEHGVEWQRGFVNTTRLPIFVDFIVEDATVTGRIGKALLIESSRGAKAIIPEDYICELVSRYGVKIQLEKCTGYKASPWTERTKTKKK